MPFDPPKQRSLEIAYTLPDTFRKAATSEWADLNLQGATLDAFLEGPVFGPDGTLYVADIPFGRIFAISPAGGWSLVAEYEGWPNGMKVLDAQRLVVADHRLGLIEVNLSTGAHTVLCHGFESRPFHGLNDLTIAPDGDIYFTDQGLSDLLDPFGRVFRFTGAGKLELVAAGIASPNGIVSSPEGRTLYLAVTRANAVWRLPLDNRGHVRKAGLFVQLSGGIGPDGLAWNVETGGLIVVHPGRGVWDFAADGTPAALYGLDGHSYVTNLARHPSNGDFFVTESMQARILRFAPMAAPA